MQKNSTESIIEMIKNVGVEDFCEKICQIDVKFAEKLGYQLVDKTFLYNPYELEPDYEFLELDQALRKMATLSGFQKDLEKYESMRQD